MKRVLVTGASGLLGSKIVKKAGSKFEVYPTHATHPFFPKALTMDITNENEVRRVFREVRPDVVIHTAAETNVDKCENRKKYASKVNSEGTRIIAEASNRIDARILYISTDYVFDGEKGLYNEEDNPNPVNHYGWTKLLGENYISSLTSEYTILRPSVLYGYHSRNPNFVLWVLSLLRQDSELVVVNDHYNSPTLADNLASIVLEIIDRGLKGVFHGAGSERTSRYDFALEIAEVFCFNKNLVRPIKMAELKQWKAKRPKDSSLCVDKIRKEITSELLGIKQGLREMKRLGSL